MISFTNKYNKAKEFFETAEKNQFRDVTLRQIRDAFYDTNYSVADVYDADRVSYFMPSIYYETFGRWFHLYIHRDKDWQTLIAMISLFWVTFITGPFYAISRFFNLMLPLFIVLYLYMDGEIVIFTDINGFQIVILCPRGIKNRFQCQETS